MSSISLHPDCTIVHDVAVAIRDWLAAQAIVKEESLTDWLLYEIDRRSSRFFYKSFTRSEEARKTGADWEWWIVLPNYALRLRLQAPKLRSSPYNHYKDLAFTNKHGLQIQKLLVDAKATNSVPLYALYSAHSMKTCCPKATNSEGVFLTSANHVYSKFIASGPIPVSAADLHAISTPLSCLICCTVGNDAKAYIYHYFAEGLAEPWSDGFPQGVHRAPPPYVLSVLERATIPDWWEQEYAHEVQGVDGVLIYDARNPYM